MSFPCTFSIDKIVYDDNEFNYKIGGAIDNKKGGAIGGAIDNKKGGAIPKLTDRQITVLQIIKSDNKISYRAIADKMDINESAVLKHLEILKEKGYIERIGGTRGSWKIKK